jgi:hypothetical protein
MLQYMSGVVSPAGTQICKPIVYASSGAAAIVYPVASISTYLGSRLVGDIVEQLFAPALDMHADARRWLGEHAVIGTEHTRPLQDSLKADSVLDGRRNAIGSAPRPDLDPLKSSEVSDEVAAQKQRLDGEWRSHASEVVEIHQAQAITRHWSALLETIAAILDGARGDWFARVRGFAHAVRDQLDARIGELQAELERDRQQLDTLIARYGGSGGTPQRRTAVEELKQSFSILPGKTSDAKAHFLQQWRDQFERSL